MDNRPILTVKEARRLLGKDSEALNDVEVMEIVVLLHKMAKDYIYNKNVNSSNNSLGLDDGLSESESS